jgi:hypothetical protein
VAMRTRAEARAEAAAAIAECVERHDVLTHISHMLASTMDIEQQLEEPGRDEKVDKAWDGMITAACESLDALFELSFEWNSKDPLQIAEALGTLECY